MRKNTCGLDEDNSFGREPLMGLSLQRRLRPERQSYTHMYYMVIPGQKHKEGEREQNFKGREHARKTRICQKFWLLHTYIKGLMFIAAAKFRPGISQARLKASRVMC